MEKQKTQVLVNKSSDGEYLNMFLRFGNSVHESIIDLKRLLHNFSGTSTKNDKTRTTLVQPRAPRTAAQYAREKTLEEEAEPSPGHAELRS
jgi:hypothetical protein